jgi:hypothetical protein
MWQDDRYDISTLRDVEREIVTLSDPDLDDSQIYLAVYDLTGSV